MINLLHSTVKAVPAMSRTNCTSKLEEVYINCILAHVEEVCSTTLRAVL